MSIFTPFEELFPVEQLETVKPQKTEFTSEQLEAQEAMQELPTESVEQTEPQEQPELREQTEQTEQLEQMEQTAQPAREAALREAWEEYDCFGESQPLKKMLEKSGLSLEEVQEYGTEKLIKEADALIESSRALLKDGRNVSFRGETVEARTKRHAVVRAAESGNKIALEHRVKDYNKQLEKEAARKAEKEAAKIRKQQERVAIRTPAIKKPQQGHK